MTNELTIRGAIFDMDGTVLDSSEMWDTAAESIVKALGYTPKPTIKEDVFPLGNEDMVLFLHEDYHMTHTVAEVRACLERRIETYYTQQATLKPGAMEFLQTLRKNGVRLALATATSMRHTIPTTKLTGLDEIFDLIVSCDEIGRTKYEPDVFLTAAERLGTDISDTWVFEDALHAICTAKRAGFHTCGVADFAAAFQHDQIMQAADCFLESLTDWRTLPFASALK